jgi:aconitate hydratase 2/2-methylisocitrate dehydratase
MRFTQVTPTRTIALVLDQYRTSAAERASLGIPPLALTASETREVVAGLEAGDAAGGAELVDLLADRVSPGVDEAAQVKADWLASVARGDRSCQAVTPADAVRLLGNMGGGFNVGPLIELLGDGGLGRLAAEQLSETLLVFDAFHDVVDLARCGNRDAEAVLNAWAVGTWFSSRPPVPRELHLTVFRVPGETNTDDLSPAPHAWSRGDIPLHALTLLENRADVEDAVSNIRRLREGGRPIAFVGDVVGTGSSRKSAVNSLLWHIGDDIPFVPNKRRGGVVLAGRIAPIFFNTLEDSGALPIECDVSALRTGDHIVVRPADGRIESSAGDVIAEFALRPDRLLDSVRAGGRVPLTVGRMLTDRARRTLGLAPSELFVRQGAPAGQSSSSSYTLAQKIVGRACGVDGVAPGTSCEPAVSTVGSQDTTGPMNRNELEDLACLGFGAELVLQTFCHTAAYPKAVDMNTQATLPDFMRRRGAVVLRPGDGIIHSWLNRMLLPDQVGTGSDSHTRFPLGISFPAGSGLVAFAAAFGVMPIDMPESVLVRFRGELQPGVTLRDLVNAIPYAASGQGLLAPGSDDRRGRPGVAPVAAGGEGGSNVFSGRIIEIEGLEHLTVEQAFELSDSTAERSAAACTIALSEASVARYLRSNLAMLRWLIDAGYQDARSLERRAQAMEGWLADPVLLRADPDARYSAVVEIDVSAITEPLLACPNDPDYIRPLSEVSGRELDEVFIGSCMTNIGHFRAASALLSNARGPVRPRLWIAPPTRMDQAQLREEGCYAVFAAAGARTEIPGCSLCMGNQATVAPGSTVVSTSTRNFPNRMGRGADVFLASAELAAVAAIEGRLPTVEAYRARLSAIDGLKGDIYRYLDFDKLPAFAGGAATGA